MVDQHRALLRQEAVRELLGRVDLRENIVTLSEFDFAESKWITFEDWLNSPTLSFARHLPLVAAITSALFAGLILAGYSAAIPWTRVAIAIGTLMAFHAGVGLLFRNRVNCMLDWVRPISGRNVGLATGPRFARRRAVSIS